MRALVIYCGTLLRSTDPFLRPSALLNAVNLADGGAVKLGGGAVINPQQVTSRLLDWQLTNTLNT